MQSLFATVTAFLGFLLPFQGNVTLCENGSCTAQLQSQYCNGTCNWYDTYWCPQDCQAAPEEEEMCGDGFCDSGEEDWCEDDCGPFDECGDGECTGDEDSSWCAGDCTDCGDGYCDEYEDPYACPDDCAGCGDGYCDEYEQTDWSCEEDCGPYAYCGDGSCDGGEEDWCEDDCGPFDECGDGECTGDEDSSWCEEDCEECGDGYCTSGEDEYSCAFDCGECGDGLCDEYEDSSWCPDDCWECGDGTCNDDEDVYSCPDDCTTCGDGECTGDEDDDSCPDDCHGASDCGNGNVDDGEDCDPPGSDGECQDIGISTGTLTCDDDCQWDTSDCHNIFCGDGIQEGDEECDDGILNSNDFPDTCRLDCVLPTCGDYITDSDEECDMTDMPYTECSEILDDYEGSLSCTSTCFFDIGDCYQCGNGSIEGPEECDESGNDTSECDYDCTFAECGDGYWNSDAGEECDDSNTNDGDGCDSNCQEEDVCGDGNVTGDEECDDGNTENGDGCSSGCYNERSCAVCYYQDDGIDAVCEAKSTEVCMVSQCNDGQDNDGDGRTDYPQDFGCYSTNDDDEGMIARFNDCAVDDAQCMNRFRNICETWLEEQDNAFPADRFLVKRGVVPPVELEGCTSLLEHDVGHGESCSSFAQQARACKRACGGSFAAGTCQSLGCDTFSQKYDVDLWMEQVSQSLNPGQTMSMVGMQNIHGGGCSAAEITYNLTATTRDRECGQCQASGSFCFPQNGQLNECSILGDGSCDANQVCCRLGNTNSGEWREEACTYITAEGTCRRNAYGTTTTAAQQSASNQVAQCIQAAEQNCNQQFGTFDGDINCQEDIAAIIVFPSMTQGYIGTAKCDWECSNVLY